MGDRLDDRTKKLCIQKNRFNLINGSLSSPLILIKFYFYILDPGITIDIPHI